MDHEITPKMRDDVTLYYRFLKARNFNVKLAEEMLRKHIAWRKQYEVDTILTDYKLPEVMLKYFAVSLIGLDKEGSPVLYTDMGVDGVGILASVKKKDCIKYCIYLTEEVMQLMDEQSKKLGKPITTMVQILNFENVTFAKATHKKSLEMMILALTTLQDNYPERIKVAYFINISRYFTMIFSFCKAVIAPALQEKIHNFGRDGWQEALQEVINVYDLPAFLGGNKTEPDGSPLCESYVVHSQVVPERYFMKKSDKSISQNPEVRKLFLYPFSKQNLTFHVKETYSILEWHFETKSKDIGFGVYFQENSDSQQAIVELVPKQRFDTYYGPETGVYKCEKTGVYIIRFDNSYSWIFPKEIYYIVRVLPPEEF